MQSTNNNWNKSHKKSESYERLGRKIIEEMGWIVLEYRGRSRDIDFLVSIDEQEYEVDIKSQFSPFGWEPTLAGLKRWNHLTLDTKHVKGQHQYADDVIILFLIGHYPTEDISDVFSGACSITMQEIRKNCARANPTRFYGRPPSKERGRQDKSAKVGVSIEECIDHTKTLSSESIKALQLEGIISQEERAARRKKQGVYA